MDLFRNTPQLLQIIMWYLLLTLLTSPRNALAFVPGHMYLSNRGLNLPTLANGFPLPAACAVVVIAGFAALWLASRCLEWRFRRVGKQVNRGLFLPLAFVAGAVIDWLIVGAPTSLVSPELRGFKYRGGQTLSPEFLALFFGLTLYIGAFIAEIVRAGLQSVPKGQLEAADSIPLSRYNRFGLVVLPQALRVVIPPAMAQYVSLLKNSSLGVAVGYSELFNVSNTTTTLSGQVLECVVLMAVLYLAISLVMNFYNRLVQIKER